MNAGTDFADVLEAIGRGALSELEGLSEETLNRPLPLPETNSLFALATHLAGSAEFWVVQAAAGRDIQRDRDAEFRAHGSYEDIKARIEAMLSATRQVLESMTSEQMDQPAAEPNRRVSWRPAPQPMRVRDCLLHAVEHAALHQGHIQITRQILVAGQDRLLPTSSA